MQAHRLHVKLVWQCLCDQVYIVCLCIQIKLVPLYAKASMSDEGTSSIDSALIHAQKLNKNKMP